jgi:hypothetical protein
MQRSKRVQRLSVTSTVVDPNCGRVKVRTDAQECQAVSPGALFVRRRVARSNLESVLTLREVSSPRCVRGSSKPPLARRAV